MTASHYSFASRRAAASPDHIRHVAGAVSDSALAAVLEIGATLEELEVATAYARGEGDEVGRRHYTLTGRIKRIFDILTRDEMQ